MTTSSSTNLEAIDCLQELMAMYMYNVDRNGEPKATIQEMVDLWEKARQVLNRAKNENIVAEGNYIQAINYNYCNCINSQLNLINGKYLCTTCNKPYQSDSINYNYCHCNNRQVHPLYDNVCLTCNKPIHG